ncbi:hypothetical protein [Sandaracinus amylolyticus]|uniref:Uncharacterized protein n=1 Tax=Sandaracinus amylolyticus TaxID=927083 RepID=A0A0F6SED3_9BACT|nr:hypothetical protein [Sandaracinus amylolyticus]AKF04994.1 hypothetical protein DB32_002143 [Sandaracinus amylolyticus]
MGWWFAPAGEMPREGRVDCFDGELAPGVSGLHAARTVLDALPFARSAQLCRVSLGGRIVERGPLIAASERTIERRFDPRALLRSIAIEIATGALDGEVLEDAVRDALRVIVHAPLSSAMSGVIDRETERASERMIDADQALRDISWRIERGVERAEVLRDAQRAAARARAHAVALETLAMIDRRGPSELEPMLEGALRALAWRIAADAETIDSTTLDDALARARAEWSAMLDARVLAILDTTRPSEPELESPIVAIEPTPDETSPPVEPPPSDDATRVVTRPRCATRKRPPRRARCAIDGGDASSIPRARSSAWARSSRRSRRTRHRPRSSMRRSAPRATATRSSRGSSRSPAMPPWWASSRVSRSSS